MEFKNIAYKNTYRDKVQDLSIRQLKLQVHVTYKQRWKKTTNFEAINDGDLMNKVYPDEKLKKKCLPIVIGKMS